MVRRRVRRWRTDDDGVTLPELLVGVALMGMVMAALSSAVIVVLKQTDNTGGRLNNARSENSIGIWMPADLASAAENTDGKLVVTAAGASPCFETCPTGFVVLGSNALLLEWKTTVSNGGEDVQQSTRVSYRYALVGDEYQLIRFECVQMEGLSQTCQQLVVLRDLDGPPNGVFVPGETEPTWIITVKDPYKPDATTEDQTDPGLISKNSSRVVVTINGGGDAAGAGGGTNQISISAGGTNRTMIDGTSLQGAPTLIAARSRCGGAITLIVDESGSIGGALTNVRNAVQGFVDAFAGTPVKLQIVRFATKSGVLGTDAQNPWSRYFDMLVDSDVTTLRGLAGGLTSSGFTNWEDALQRTFYEQDGRIQAVLPRIVVFFTDGEPTYDRQGATSATSPINPPAAMPGYPVINPADIKYNQMSFHRADAIASTFRDSIRFIGVGVGSGIAQNKPWISSVPGWHYEFFRKYRFDYTRSYHYDYARNYHSDYRRFYHIERSFKYQTKVGSTWSNVSLATYTAQTNASLKRTVITNPTGTLDYWENDPTATASTGLATGRRVSFAAPFSFGRVVTMTSQPTVEGATNWNTTSNSPYATNQAAFNAQNVTANGDAASGDGWSRTKNYTSPYNETDTGVSGSGYTNNASWTRTKDYTAPFTNTDNLAQNGTGYVETDPSWTRTKVYASPYSFTEPSATGGTGYDSSSGSWVRTKVYTAPYDFFDSPIVVQTPGSVILSRLITGGSDTGTPGIADSDGNYTNAGAANMYILPDFGKFKNALEGVALAECGGTLTVQTRLASGAGAPDPFTYQKSKVWDNTGAVITSDNTIVTTTRNFASGTFDLATKTYLDIEIQPVNLSDRGLYTPGSWSCKAGTVAVPFTLVDVANSAWDGIKVRVAANQAVSCTQRVSL